MNLMIDRLATDRGSLTRLEKVNLNSLSQDGKIDDLPLHNLPDA